MVNLKRKNKVYFGTLEEAKGLLVSLFRQLNFKPLVFGTLFGEMSSNDVTLVETTVEYEVEHLGRNMAAITVDTLRTTLRGQHDNMTT